jgi:hypothetical protein
MLAQVCGTMFLLNKDNLSYLSTIALLDLEPNNLFGRKRGEERFSPLLFIAWENFNPTSAGLTHNVYLTLVGHFHLPIF